MKTISILLLFIVFVNAAFADCDFSKGITPGPNKTFIYSEECHQKVGKLVEDNATKDAQIQDLTKALSLKDLSLQASDARISLWQKTSDDELSRLTAIQSEEKKSEWLFFSLGVASTFLAGYMASQLIRK